MIAAFLQSSMAIVPSENPYSFMEIANLAVAVAILFAGGLSVFYVFVGGISFILSGGQEDKIKTAVHTIRYAIIGLVVTFLAVIMITVVGRILDLDLISYLRWEKITALISKIMGSLSSSKKTTSGTLQMLLQLFR